jgi:hypothetical protein
MTCIQVPDKATYPHFSKDPKQVHNSSCHVPLLPDKTNWEQKGCNQVTACPVCLSLFNLTPCPGHRLPDGSDVFCIRGEHPQFLTPCSKQSLKRRLRYEFDADKEGIEADLATMNEAIRRLTERRDALTLMLIEKEEKEEKDDDRVIKAQRPVVYELSD